jgi:hypothetical protein
VDWERLREAIEIGQIQAREGAQENALLPHLRMLAEERETISRELEDCLGRLSKYAEPTSSPADLPPLLSEPGEIIALLHAVRAAMLREGQTVESLLRRLSEKLQSDRGFKGVWRTYQGERGLTFGVSHHYPDTTAHASGGRRERKLASALLTRPRRGKPTEWWLQETRRRLKAAGVSAADAEEVLGLFGLTRTNEAPP